MSSSSSPSSRAPLPFGLGREPQCDPARCLKPGTPLPAAGSPLHDQVAHSLSSLFSTFFATSLRYLGVSEILDWLEQNHTIDAWILTGLEQGRSPVEVGNEKNLEVGRGALRSVIKAALEQEDEAWATSLREVGFSSGMSMAFEGVIAQLKYNKSSPLPCLHTLITASGLAMLKSAPLKHAFPVCPPRTAPSCHSLLASIREDIASRTLSGPLWRQSTVWKPQVRRAFARYHAMVKEVAEDIVCEPSFSKEYNIFLDSISQPINLFDLISQDFAAEFGPGACKGLLGVGDAGGMNLHQIMDFCAAKRPSELLARVKQRVAEKQEKEKVRSIFEKKRERIEEIRREEQVLQRRKGELTQETDEIRAEGVALAGRTAALAKEREALEKEVESELASARELAAGAKKDQLLLEEEQAMDPHSTRSGSKQGSSKDMLYIAPGDTPTDPFAACAPRAISPSPTSAKGKGRAVTPAPSVTRPPSRYLGRDPIPPRSMSPLSSHAPSPAPSSPLASSLYTPPPSPPRRAAARMASPSRSSGANGTNGSSTTTAAVGAKPVSARRAAIIAAHAPLLPPPALSRISSEAVDQSISSQLQAQLEATDLEGSCCIACAAEIIGAAKRKEIIGKAKEHVRLLGLESAAAAAAAAASEPMRQARSSSSTSSHSTSSSIADPISTAARHARAILPLPATRKSVPAATITEIGVDAAAIQEAALADLLGTTPSPNGATSATIGGEVHEDDPLETATAAKKKSKKKKSKSKARARITTAAAAPEGVTFAPITANGDGHGAMRSCSDASTVPAGLTNGVRQASAATKASSAAASRPISLRSTLLGAVADLDPQIVALGSSSYVPLSQVPPPHCCPPDRCAGDTPLPNWAELDSLLHQVCLEGFRYELIDSLIDPLVYLRDQLAKEYLVAGGKLKSDEGELDRFMASIEKDLWKPRYPKIAEFCQATLALSLQKLMEVLRAQVGKLCLCRISQRSDVLLHAQTRLAQCALADSKLPVHLGEMEFEGQPFMRWCHVQLRAGFFTGAEWEGRERAYRVADFLTQFADAFDLVVDRMMERDPYAIAEEMTVMLEWMGGIRTFERAMRLANRDLGGAGQRLGEGFVVGAGKEDGKDLKKMSKDEMNEMQAKLGREEAERPMQSWSRVVALGLRSRREQLPFGRDWAIEEKRRGNVHFAAGEYAQSIVAFEAASIIDPTDVTFYTNAAAARIKVGTHLHLAEAVSDCTIALELDSTNVKALYRRGIALAKLGKWNASLVDLKLLLERNPDNVEGEAAFLWVKQKIRSN